jgi:hypothetical protein
MKMKFELVFSVLLMLLYFFVGDLFLQMLFIPDSCYYHDHQTPLYIELLFDFPSSEGYHPVATKFGYLLAGFIGFILGKIVSKFSRRKRTKNEN